MVGIDGLVYYCTIWVYLGNFPRAMDGCYGAQVFTTGSCSDLFCCNCSCADVESDRGSAKLSAAAETETLSRRKARRVPKI